MARVKRRSVPGILFGVLHVLHLLTFVSSEQATVTKILEHSAIPPVVANCSATTLTCRVEPTAHDVNVWWTFRGENATKLPSTELNTNRSKEGIWELQIQCATLEHAGTYACSAHAPNAEFVYRKETTLTVYVPVSIELSQNLTADIAGSNVTLECRVTAYPTEGLRVEWEKEGVPVENEPGRLEVSTDATQGKYLVVSTVMIEALHRKDNGTYTCKANSNYSSAVALQDVLVIEPPEVDLEEVEAQDPRTAILRWTVRYRGNLPLKRFHLQVKNYSSGADWSDVDDKIPPNVTAYTVRYLAPAVTYGFQLAAINEAVQSEWETRNITMPPDVPARVSLVHMLASTNETLLLGWRRPSHDNGANITLYNMQLTQHERVIHNKNMSVSTEPRNNHMFIFVNLEPGQKYNFRVRACNVVGCGNWSEPLEVETSDGSSDPPQNVTMSCNYDDEGKMNWVLVKWKEPVNSRGTILGYNVTLEGHSRFRNASGHMTVEQTKQTYEVKVKLVNGSQVTRLEFKSTVEPNTNYTVRVCAMNRAGCGPLSMLTPESMCPSRPNVPSSFPKFHLRKMEDKENCQQLVLHLQRVSERNGIIKCYHIVIIKLKKGETVDKLPADPLSLNITSYAEVHRTRGHGAYFAESFNTEKFRDKVIIGDNRFTVCEPLDESQHPLQPESRIKRTVIEPPQDNQGMANVNDGTLAPNTNYTAFVQVTVTGQNGTLTAASNYVTATLTGSPPLVPTESPIAIIFGVVCGLILVALVLIVVLCILRHKNNQIYEDGERVGLTALIRRTIARNGHLPRGKGSHPSKLPHFGSILAEDLPAAFQERHIDSDLLFQSEFEALPEKFKDRTTHASDSPENVGKNRYPDIKSYDQTRVRLPMIDGVAGSDYINADFVEGYKGRKTFICAQGPLDRTVTDFWRMIWEHKVTVIVMLTGIEEHGKVKCARYWSDESVKEIEKMFVISVKSAKKYSDYIVRRFQVQHTKDGFTEEREILHFHFLMWKDFLAPEQPSWLLRFIKRVNEHYCSDRGPLLVHCSAGVGRTGTFVAIDTLLQQLEEEGAIDIFTIICTLRRQRNFLVQSLKQYMFVYRALMEHAQFGDTEVEICHLRDHYRQLKEKIGDTEKTGLELEFEKLGDVIEDAKTCCTGTMDINMNKNRYDFIIPYDINRVILPPSPSRDHASYINASFIQGYDRSLSFIITQDPLECTITEFWRMVKEQGITVIVMLSELGDGQTKCQRYWPEDEEKEYDYVRVKLETAEKYTDFLKRQFLVTNVKNNDMHTVTQFQFLGWTGQAGVVPDSTSSLINLIEHIQQCQEQSSGSGPVTVHCSGGGDRSSVFVTLSVLIQQLKVEERVDVFQAARYTRSQRHCMLQTLVQYDFLYRGLLDYMESHNLCDMGDTQL